MRVCWMIVAGMLAGTAAAEPPGRAAGEVSFRADGIFSERRDMAAIGGAGTVTAEVEEGLGVQLDLSGSTFLDSDGDETALFGAGHLFRRGGNWAAGLTAGGGEIGGYRTFTGGAEAVIFLDTATLQADTDATCASILDACAVTGGVTGSYFVTDNLALRLHGSLGRLMHDLPGQRNVATLAAEIAYRVPDTAFGARLSAGHMRHFGGGRRDRYDSVSLSLVYFLGTGSLEDHARRGAVFRDTAAPLRGMLGGILGVVADLQDRSR